MKVFPILGRTAAIPMAFCLAGLLSGPAMAHCDSMDGPVVKDAQRALAAGDVTPVLKWVGVKDETPIRQTFDMALAVRGESEKAKAVADMYFFETLVRIHRATEGEGFTGLKPAGGVDPIFATADRALVDGDITALADKVSGAVRNGIQERFAETLKKRQQAESSVEQGREFVAAYVQYTHFIENAAHLASSGAEEKHRETAENGH